MSQNTDEDLGPGTRAFFGVWGLGCHAASLLCHGSLIGIPVGMMIQRAGNAYLQGAITGKSNKDLDDMAQIDSNY